MMLAEYCKTYGGRQVTNADFIRIAKTYIGEKRSEAFFRQWLYDSKIPEFVCHYAIQPDTKGRPMVQFRIEVRGVREGFETPYPVEIEFDDGTSELYRLDGVGRQTEFVLAQSGDCTRPSRPFSLRLSNTAVHPWMTTATQTVCRGSTNII